MKLSQRAILEILTQVQLDRDEAVSQIADDGFAREIREILKPIDLLVYWLSREEHQGG